MLRRTMIVIALLVVAVTPPATARLDRGRSFTMTAPVPCTAVCAYWLDEFNAETREAGVRFNACKQPFPPGSYDDVVVRAPAGAVLLEFSGSPSVDWDLFVCRYPARDGKGGVLATGANSATQCQVACPETAEAPVKPGKRYVLRAYNWSDPLPLQARVRFLG